MPVGYLITTIAAALCTWLAVAPRRRPRALRGISFGLGFLVNEQPFLVSYLLLASTALAIGQGQLDTPVGWTAFGAALVATFGLAIITRRQVRAKAALADALRHGLGADWQSSLDSAPGSPLSHRRPWARILFAPFVFRRRDVERVANVAYGDAGAENRLDVYRHRSRPSARSHPDPPARRTLSQRQEEPRSTCALLPVRERGVGVHQRELPSRTRGDVP